jgi:hypothetical protein
VSKLILPRPTVRLSALTVAGLLTAAKASSFPNTSLLIIREGKSDRRVANRLQLVGRGELLRGVAERKAGRPAASGTARTRRLPTSVAGLMWQELGYLSALRARPRLRFPPRAASIVKKRPT